MIDSLPTESLKLAVVAERKLLGSLLHRPDFIHEVSAIVDGASFYDREFAVLFDTLHNVAKQGLQIDPWAIANMVFKESQLTVEAIAVSVQELKHEVANAAHVKYYATQVAKWHSIRSVRSVGFSLIDETEHCTEKTEASELLAQAAKAIQEASVVREDEVLDCVQLVDGALERIDRAMVSGESTGIATGFREIDSRWGGLYDGELTILAARPSIGKSALGMSIALNLAEQGKSVFFASLEMTRDQVGYRLLSRMTGISCDRLRQAILSQDQLTMLMQARQNLNGLKLRVWCASGVTVQDIESRARLHSSKHGLDAVFIDYMGQGKIKPIKRHGSANDSITEVIGDIATMTKRLVKPVVCLCQLNRAAEEQEPTLANLRDSGSIEQDADNVWFLHRKRSESSTSFIVAKCRNGEIGSASLRFNGDRATFEDVPCGTPFTGDFA
jgi:replicative DNA helicase